MGIRAHVLKHLNGSCIAIPSEKMFHEGTLWRGNRLVISFILHKSSFIHLYHQRDVFYNRYIEIKVKKKCIDDDGTGVIPISQY